MQELEKRELLMLRELVAANVPSNLEAPGLDGSERSRIWLELREIQESIANKKQRAASREWPVTGPRSGKREKWYLPLRHELEHSGRE